jgi:hypothetical protein
MKQRNPNWGCPRIAQQIALAFHIQIDKEVPSVRGEAHRHPATRVFNLSYAQILRE